MTITIFDPLTGKLVTFETGTGAVAFPCPRRTSVGVSGDENKKGGRSRPKLVGPPQASRFGATKLWPQRMP
jgi:hypothetical protein